MLAVCLLVRHYAMPLIASIVPNLYLILADRSFRENELVLFNIMLLGFFVFWPALVGTALAYWSRTRARPGRYGGRRGG